MKKFNIGDIVFVTNYQYKSGCKGERHCFVLIDEWIGSRIKLLWISGVLSFAEIDLFVQ